MRSRRAAWSGSGPEDDVDPVVRVEESLRIRHAVVGPYTKLPLPPQNPRRGHHELGGDARAHRRVANAFTELARNRLNGPVTASGVSRGLAHLNATEPY